MSDQFERFLEECISSFGEEYIDVPEEMQAPHKFSRRFSQKMRRLMRQQSSGFSIVRVPRKRRLSMAITITILVFLSLSTAAICGGRNLFSGFFTEVFADNILIWNNPQEDAQDTIEEVYMPTWLPDGYELVKADTSLDYSHLYYYCNDPECDHRFDNHHIKFMQLSKESYIDDFDNENCDAVQITVNNYSGIEIIGNSYYIIWNDEKYTFRLLAPVYLNKDDVLITAKSVQKIE